MLCDKEEGCGATRSLLSLINFTYSRCLFQTLFTNPNFTPYKQILSRSLCHVNHPFLIAQQTQHSVGRQAVCDTIRPHADASVRIVDVGLEMKDDSFHFLRVLAQEGQGG